MFGLAALGWHAIQVILFYRLPEWTDVASAYHANVADAFAWWAELLFCLIICALQLAIILIPNAFVPITDSFCDQVVVK